MPPVDPFVKAAVPGRGRAPIVAATHGYLTPWIPPPSPNKVSPPRALMGQDHLACLPAVRVQSTPNYSPNAATSSPIVGTKRAGRLITHPTEPLTCKRIAGSGIHVGADGSRGCRVIRLVRVAALRTALRETLGSGLVNLIVVPVRPRMPQMTDVSRPVEVGPVHST